MSDVDPPAGYVRVTVGRCTVVTLAEHEADARALLAEGSLYEAAARDLGARPLAGRGVAYAIDLPITRTPVVVRHNRHGGLFAPVTRDLFLPPTRAPYELDVAMRLATAGVRTPQVMMYGLTATALLWRRADVMTREIGGGRDLASYMMPEESPTARALAWEATRVLVRALDAVGARHHDLNVKNILLSPVPSGLEAHVLDVDRVAFGVPNSRPVRLGNLRRLLRSARKWRAERGALFDDRELDSIA